MLRSTAVHAWLATLAVAAALVALVLDATSMVRLPPKPSTRSRANDTPVLHHVGGGGPDGGTVQSNALALIGVAGPRPDRGLPPNSVWCDLVAEPVAGQTLYAQCADGLFKTTDGGGLWRQLDIDNPQLPVIAPSGPRVLYQPPFAGLVRSRDGGRRWTAIEWPRRAQDLCRSGIAVDPLEASTPYCAGDNGVLVSRNDGVQWRPMPRWPVEASVQVCAIAMRQPL